MTHQDNLGALACRLPYCVYLVVQKVIEVVDLPLQSRYPGFLLDSCKASKGVTVDVEPGG